MTVRDTSKEAYQELCESKALNTQANYIFSILEQEKSGRGMTLKEISRKSGIEINAVSGRVNGLKSQGVVIEVNKRKCSITGRTVTPVAVLRNIQMELL